MFSQAGKKIVKNFHIFFTFRSGKLSKFVKICKFRGTNLGVKVKKIG